MALLAKTKKKKKKKKKNLLSPQQKIEQARKRSFISQHRSIFTKAGFARVAKVDGSHFTFEGVKSEIDDVFVYENVVVFAEYTMSAGASLSAHVKGKSGSHNKIASNAVGFLDELAKLCKPLLETL